MIWCPRCKNPIPDNFISCPACAATKNAHHTEIQQRLLVPAALAANGFITLAVYVDGTHIARLGAPQVAMCGREIKRGRREDIRIREVGGLQTVCVSCAAAFAAAAG